MGVEHSGEMLAGKELEVNANETECMVYAHLEVDGMLFTTDKTNNNLKHVYVFIQTMFNYKFSDVCE